MRNMACSACYGSGCGVDEKPCPCGCRPTLANAGPPQGDHPTDRAINAMPLPQYPIAPPVAAGSVDTPEFREVLHTAIMCKSSMQIQCNAALLDYIDAWGAQQRTLQQEENNEIMRDWSARVVAAEKCAEKAEEGLAQLQYERDNLQKLAISRREWAEKAEADLKQVNERREAALASNQQAHELMVSKLDSAEARVKELEAEDLAMHRKLAAEKLRADQGWARYEAANRAKNDLERERGHKQSIIDRLMLEYCPDEMTAEQMAEWGKHQVRAE